MKKIIYIFTVLVFVCTGIFAPLSAKGKLEPGPVLSGSVMDTDGNPVVGAVVTDGFTQSETDIHGNFRFESPSPFRVRFVSVRIPSGYLPVLKKGVPVFFAAVPAYKGRERKATITLVKRKEAADTWSMMMIADPQAAFYDPSQKSENIGYAGTDVWKDMFADMRQTVSSADVPFYGMCMGDIAALSVGAKSAYPSVYPEYCKGTESLGIPFFNVVGNHDHLLNMDTENDDESVLTYEDFFGPRNYSFDLGQVHFVVVDNCIYIKGYRRYPMMYGLEDEFLEWLKGDLARVPKDMPVIVCQHADVFSGNGVQKWVFEGKPGTYKLNEFLELLQGFEKMYVFAGHTHAGEFIGRIESPANPSGVEAFIVGRGVGGYANEHTCPEGTPRGYVIMDVNGKDISWRYHLQQVDNAPFRGKKKPDLKLRPTLEDEQLRAYSRGSYGDDFVYANVYLWDKHWQTPLLRIGDNTYPMIRDDVYELSYKEIIKAYQPWSQKKLNYSGRRTHSFLVRVPQDASGEGIVEVTDRWGRTWTHTVSVDPLQYTGNGEYVHFDFREVPAVWTENAAGDISFSCEQNGKVYTFALSGGAWEEGKGDDEAHLRLTSKGSRLQLPALDGYKLTSILVQPFGNRHKGQAAFISDSSGNPADGGDRLLFYGNATDGWELNHTLGNTAYQLVCDSNSGRFVIGELRLTYEPVQ